MVRMMLCEEDYSLESNCKSSRAKGRCCRLNSKILDHFKFSVAFSPVVQSITNL